MHWTPDRCDAARCILTDEDGAKTGETNKGREDEEGLSHTVLDH
jgi:hypothetical protein